MKYVKQCSRENVLNIYNNELKTIMEDNKTSLWLLGSQAHAECDSI